MQSLRSSILVSLLLLLAHSLFATAPAATTQRDSVVIDQKNFRLLGIPESTTSSRTARVLITLETKVTLASHERSFLRAAINLDNPESFRPVFAKEVEKGYKEHEIKLEIDHPKQKIIRVIVWLDKDGGITAPRPLASDNIAFDAKAFLNSNDR